MYTFPDIVVVHGQVRIGMICLRGGGGYHVTDDTNSIKTTTEENIYSTSNVERNRS